MKHLRLSVGMALLLTGTASAQSGSQPEPYRALLECRSRTDDAARLRCLDAALAAMETARGRGDVLVSSRAETVAARRSLFGFTVPQFLRGDGQNDEREEIKELKTTVRSARDTGFMKYSLDLAEGGSWQTTDPHKGAPPPRTGTSVTIRRSALGSYFLHIPGQSPLRARRTN